MKKTPETSNQSLSDFFGHDIDDETILKFFKNFDEYLEKNSIKEPESYKKYKLKEKFIENAISKNSLCKIFCLIVKGINYNDKIASEYYSNKKDETPNPKVTAIYLRELREAGIIRRGAKDGRKQIYEIDWRGLFDIILFRRILDFKTPYKPPTNFLFSQALYGFIENYDGTYTWLPKYNMIYSPIITKTEKGIELNLPEEEISENRVEEFLNTLCFNVFSSYVEEYINLKLREFRKEKDEPYPHTEIKYITEVKDEIYLDNIDITIYDILNSFDKEMMDDFPKTFAEELKTYYGWEDSFSDFPLFIFNLFLTSNYIFKDKSQYLKRNIPNPKHVFLKAINNECKEAGFQFEVVDINE